MSGSTVHGGSMDGGMDHRSGMDGSWSCGMVNWSTVNGRGSMNNGSSMNDRGSVNNRSSVDDRSCMDDRSSMVGGGRVRDSIRVSCGALVGHLGDVTVDGVGVVVDMLRPAIRQVDGVGTLRIARTVIRLGSLEIGCGVVVSNCIVVSVGGDFIGVDLGRSICRSWVGKDRRGMDQRCSVNHGGNTVGNTMANKSMAENTVTYCMRVSHDPMTCPMQSVGMVGNSSDGGAKGFRLGGGSMLSLEGLRD